MSYFYLFACSLAIVWSSLASARPHKSALAGEDTHANCPYAKGGGNERSPQNARERVSSILNGQAEGHPYPLPRVRNGTSGKGVND
ncbi:MAG: hypothetical protein KDD35_02970 [Bdellovibrionales bacterium]|nr:hypothetical protein [Bdellovibrionales bacterium]